MSAPYVSYEVWINGLLAASRFEALAKRAHALCAELSEIAERWQKARDHYGEDCPAWSYGDTELPASVRNLLAGGELAGRAAKVEETRFREYSSEEAGSRALWNQMEVDLGDLENVLKEEGASPKLAGRVTKLMNGPKVSSDFADRVAKDLKAQGVSGDLPEYIAEVLKAGGGRRLAKKLESTRMGDTFGATGGELEAVARDVSELEAFVRDLAGRVGKAKREHAQFNVRKSLQATAQEAATRAASLEERREREEADKAGREERERRRISEQVFGLVESLTAEVSPLDRTAIAQRAREAVESTQVSRRRALLTQLHLDVRRANEAGRARQRRVDQVEQWRQRLMGLEGPEVEELDETLRRVVDEEGPLPQDAAQRVESVVARATEAANRAYALGVISEELENLGYVVEADFETASEQAPEMLLRKPDMEDDYLVSLRAEAAGLRNRVVREADDPGERSAGRERTDQETERAWCEDLAAALAAAEHKGVRGRAVERMEPGAAPVPTIAPLKGKPRSTRRSRRRRERTGRQESRVRR